MDQVIAVPLGLPHDLLLHYRSPQPFAHEAALGFCLLRGRSHPAVFFHPQRLPVSAPAPEEELVTIPEQKFIPLPRRLVDAAFEVKRQVGLPITRVLAPLEPVLAQFRARYMLVGEKEDEPNGEDKPEKHLEAVKSVIAQSRDRMLAPETIARRSGLDLGTTRRTLNAGVRKNDLALVLTPKRARTNWAKCYVRLRPEARDQYADDPVLRDLSTWQPLEMWRIDHGISLKQVKHLIQEGVIEISEHPRAEGAHPSSTAQLPERVSFDRFVWRPLTASVVEELRRRQHDDKTKVLAPETHTRVMLERAGVKASGWEGLVDDSPSYSLVFLHEEGTHRRIGALRFDLVDLITRLDADWEIVSPTPPLWLIQHLPESLLPALPVPTFLSSYEHWDQVKAGIEAADRVLILYPKHPALAWCPCCKRLFLRGDTPCECGCQLPMKRRDEIGAVITGQVGSLWAWEHVPWEIRAEQTYLPPRRIYIGDDESAFSFALGELKDVDTVVLLLPGLPIPTDFLLWRFRSLLGAIACFWPQAQVVIYDGGKILREVLKITPESILRQRLEHRLPPYFRLIRVGTYAKDRQTAERLIRNVWQYFLKGGYMPSAPKSCPISKLNGWMRYHFFIRLPQDRPISIPNAEEYEGIFVDLAPIDVL